MLRLTFSTSFFEKNGYLKQKTLEKIPIFLKKKFFFLWRLYVPSIDVCLKVTVHVTLVYARIISNMDLFGCITN